MEFGEISWVNTGVKSSSVHIPITQLDCEQFIIQPLLGSEKVGPAELKKREPKIKREETGERRGGFILFPTFFLFPPRQLFACLLLLGFPHYLRAWNRYKPGVGERCLIWFGNDFFFPKPTDNFDRFSYFVRCKYRYISSIKNVFILFLSSPIPPPSQNSVGWPSYFTANGYQHAWVFRWFRWKLGKFD